MKKIKILLYLMAVIAIMLSINACNESSEPTGSSSVVVDDNFTPAELPIVDDFIGDLQGLDLNSDFYIIYPDEKSVDSKNAEIQCGDKDKKDKDKYKDDDDDGDDHHGKYDDDDDDGDDDHHGKYDDDDGDDHHRKGCKNGINPLGKILNQLGLTKDQRKAIYNFRHDYHDCLKYAKKQIRNREKAIIDEANQQKREIREQYKNGEITKDEAEDLMEQLQEQIRNKLKNCVQDEIIDCVCEYLNNILSVLDQSQAEQFVEEVSTQHPEFSICFDTTPPPPPPDTQ